MITALFLMLTEDCNLRCTYCYEKGKEHRSMDIETAKKSIDWLFSQESKELSITLFGGEPLFNFPVFKFAIEYIRQKEQETGKSCQVDSSTNGTILTEEILETLHKLDVLQISVDGIREAQDATRPTASGKGSFELIEKNIPKFLTLPDIRIRMTFTPDTLPRLAESVKFFYEQGFNRVKASEVQEADWKGGHIVAYEKQLSEIAEYLYQHRFRALQFESITDPVYKRLDKDEYPCGVCVTMVAVVPGGDIYPCTRFFTYTRRVYKPEMLLGNIDTGIDEDKMKVFKDCKTSCMYSGNNKCGDCTHSPYCDRCMIANLEFCGKLEEVPEMHCKLGKVEELISKRFESAITQNNANRKVDEILELASRELQKLNIGQHEEQAKVQQLVMKMDSMAEMINKLDRDNRLLQQELGELRFRLMLKKE